MKQTTTKPETAQDDLYPRWRDPNCGSCGGSGYSSIGGCFECQRKYAARLAEPKHAFRPIDISPLNCGFIADPDSGLCGLSADARIHQVEPPKSSPDDVTNYEQREAAPSCAECGKTMTYDKGSPATRHEPEQPECWHCDDCGITREVKYQNAMSNGQPICPEHGARWIRNGVCVFDGFGFSEICGHVCPAPAQVEPPPGVTLWQSDDGEWFASRKTPDAPTPSECFLSDGTWTDSSMPGAGFPSREVLLFALGAAVEAAPTLDPETDAADGWEIDAARRIVKTNKGTLAESLWQGEINNIAAIIREAHGSRVAELKEALQPFVAVAKGYRDSQTDDLILLRAFDSWGKHYDLTLGDLRAAHRVLEVHAACAAKEKENDARGA